jgi:hypothetical protein
MLYLRNIDIDSTDFLVSAYLYDAKSKHEMEKTSTLLQQNKKQAGHGNTRKYDAMARTAGRYALSRRKFAFSAAFSSTTEAH